MSGEIQQEIERLVDRAGSTMKVRPTLHLDGPVRTAVGQDLVPDLLAVLGEALSNVSRHADASAVHVTVAAGAEILVRVVDDGVGINPAAPQSGLDNMRRRAEKHGGTLSVLSEPGAGTTLTWAVPVTKTLTPPE